MDREITHSSGQFNLRNSSRAENGFSLVEALVSLTLFLILSLNVLQNTLVTYNSTHRTIRNSVAMEVALEAMEQLSNTDPQTLSDLNDATEYVTRDGTMFSKSLEVTIESDRSRTVEVVVRGPSDQAAGEAYLRNSFSLWGTR